MAQRVQVLLEDDLDGGTAEESISFALDGATYEIDLSTSNAEKMREVLAPYVSAARSLGRSARSGGGRGRAADSASSRPARSSAQGPSRSDTGKIREWARENGHQISDRGRLAASVVAAYDAAHAA